MSIIRYDNGETRDAATMCNHCKGNCVCPGTKWSINASPGCGGGMCCCPTNPAALALPAPRTGQPGKPSESESAKATAAIAFVRELASLGCRCSMCGLCAARRFLRDHGGDVTP